MKTPGILQNVAESIPVDKVDVIVVSHEYGLYQNLEGGFYGSLKQLNKPIVTVLHAVGNWNVDKVICETSDRVVVHNEFCARRLGHPSVIIPHGCSPEQCVDSAEAKRSYGFKPEWPIVGYLGFISDYKNLEILVEAMAKVPEAGLLIGGGWHTGEDTPYIEELKRRSFEVLPNRVQWLGFVPDDALPRAYGCMDIVVYPPRFATESGALLMALGHGKATLASRLAPFREKERRGALETFTDAADLRRRVRRLLRDGDARKRLEAGAWQYAQDFSWSKIAELHLSLYQDVVSKF
jgi:glycosyltransferase involved in cell wall biosynthesis